MLGFWGANDFGKSQESTSSAVTTSFLSVTSDAPATMSQINLSSSTCNTSGMQPPSRLPLLLKPSSCLQPLGVEVSLLLMCFGKSNHLSRAAVMTHLFTIHLPTISGNLSSQRCWRLVLGSWLELSTSDRFRLTPACKAFSSSCLSFSRFIFW